MESDGGDQKIVNNSPPYFFTVSIGGKNGRKYENNENWHT